jgi:anti-sigma factor RsiW
MNPSSQQFDDPVLKEALNRLYSSEGAPDTLRRRVVARLAEPPLAGRLAIGRRPAFRLAAAAVAAVAITGLIYYAIAGGSSHGAIRNDLLLALLQDHDGCSQRAVEMTDGKDEGLVVQTLEQKLHRPILAPNLTRDGWRFEGGSVCRVGGRETAHLVFSRGCQRLSVYSMAAGGCADGACSTCRQMARNHVVAGLVKMDALYCVIGQCPKGELREQEVEGLLKNHQGEIIQVAAQGPR